MLNDLLKQAGERKMDFYEWWALIESSGFARGKEGEAMKAAAHDAWREAQRQEREACAKVCAEVSAQAVNNSLQYQTGREMGATICANMIRKRSNFKGEQRREEL